MITKQPSNSIAEELADITAIAAARARWIPQLHRQVETLEQAILQHRAADVERLCNELLTSGRTLGSSSFGEAASDVSQHFAAGDERGAYDIAHTIEERLDLLAGSVDRQIAVFARAATAYQRARDTRFEGVSPSDHHRLFAIDVHRVAHRFGDDLAAFYSFALGDALPQLRVALDDLRPRILHHDDASVESLCERAREIAVTIGARTVHAGINLVERSYRQNGHLTLELLRDTQHELAAVTRWVSDRARR